MQKNIHIPYNMVWYFTNKSCGAYNHVNAMRIYVYLLYYSSGRTTVKFKQGSSTICLNRLHEVLGVSRNTIKSEVKWLEQKGLVEIKENYITAISRSKFGKKLDIKITNHMRFEISYEQLLDIKIYRSVLMSIQMHKVASCYGTINSTKSIDRVIPATESFKRPDSLSNDFEDSSLIKRHCTQMLASTYVGAVIGKNPQNLKRCMKQLRTHIDEGKIPNVKYQEGTRSVLRSDGEFSGDTWSTMEWFHTKEQANERITALKKQDYKKFNSCFSVKAANSTVYVIVRMTPYRYSFNINTKRNWRESYC